MKEMEDTIIEQALIGALLKIKERLENKSKLSRIRKKIKYPSDCTNLEDETYSSRNLLEELLQKKNSPLLKSRMTDRSSQRRQAVIETDINDRLIVKETLNRYMKLQTLTNICLRS